MIVYVFSSYNSKSAKYEQFSFLTKEKALEKMTEYRNNIANEKDVDMTFDTENYVEYTFNNKNYVCAFCVQERTIKEK